MDDFSDNIYQTMGMHLLSACAAGVLLAVVMIVSRFSTVAGLLCLAVLVAAAALVHHTGRQFLRVIEQEMRDVEATTLSTSCASVVRRQLASLSATSAGFGICLVLALQLLVGGTLLHVYASVLSVIVAGLAFLFSMNVFNQILSETMSAAATGHEEGSG